MIEDKASDLLKESSYEISNFVTSDSVRIVHLVITNGVVKTESRKYKFNICSEAHAADLVDNYTRLVLGKYRYKYFV